MTISVKLIERAKIYGTEIDGELVNIGNEMEKMYLALKTIADGRVVQEPEGFTVMCDWSPGAAAEIAKKALA